MNVLIYSRYHIWPVLCVLIGLMLGPALADDDQIVTIERPEFARQIITITTPTGQAHPFNVEIADSSDKKTFGLMFKKRLAADDGMIFIWDQPALRQFWMHNTYLSLDILFFDADGVLLHIKPEATPLSKQIIPSFAPALYVVELRAGEAKKRKITLGSQLKLE